MVAGGVPFPMLSDGGGGKVGTALGVYDEDAGVENRGRFIIDPEGIIQAYEVLTPPVGISRNPAGDPGLPVGSGEQGGPRQHRPVEARLTLAGA